MIKLVSTEQMIFTQDNEDYDFDRYVIEARSQISTKEYNVIVDFKTKEIEGDVVAHGDWYDIETEECVELLEGMLKNNKPLRDFSHILKKVKKELK